MELNKDNFNVEIQLNGNTIKARKWKAKEKLFFKKNYEENMDECLKKLVYDCLEDPNVGLSTIEFEYVFIKLREASLGDNINLEFYCEECEKRFISNIFIKDVYKPVFKVSNVIKTKNNTIKIGKIKNKKFYDDITSQNPESLAELDFYLRIETINDEDVTSLEDVIEYFENLDVAEFDEIFSQWDEISFKIDLTYTVKCSKCSAEKEYEFDEMPGFIPSSWYN